MLAAEARECQSREKEKREEMKEKREKVADMWTPLPCVVNINKTTFQNSRMAKYCNEYGTIYAILSDFGNFMTTQSMGLMVLLSEHV